MSSQCNKFFKSTHNVYSHFNKKFEFDQNEIYSLPDQVFTTGKWTIPLLQERKHKLNEIKGQLSKYNLQEWSKHTKSREPSGFVIKFLKREVNPELLTQAWCKFYECLSQYKVIPGEAILSETMSSVHLCEAPGGFISALNHYLALNYPQIEWTWLGNTLNPEFEGHSLSQMIPDDRLICCTRKNWNFGADLTGDIKKFYNHLDLINTVKLLNKVWLVTADGSVDCMSNPGGQESTVQHLIYCEIMTALSILEKGGSFVVKIFTIFEESTICLLYLLTCTFSKIHIFKPSTSKSGNSEMYVICLKYKGKEILNLIWESILTSYKYENNIFSMFSLSEIDPNFIQQIISCADLFAEKQIFTISENIRYFKSKCYKEKSKNYELKTAVANNFLTKYKISSIPSYRRLVQKKIPEVATFYYRLWNWENKWTFKQNCIVLKVSNIFEQSEFCLEKHFGMKFGRSVQQITYSNFCANVNSPLSFSLKLNYSNLYALALRSVENNFIVINQKDFVQNVPYHVLHKHMLGKLRKIPVNKNILFLSVTFLTRFLVGLLFLMMTAFKHVCFYKSGFVALLGPIPYKVKIVLKQINAIHKRLKSNLLQSDYFPDIHSIISLSELKENDFFEALWNYNNSF